jgi:hypothetical protein
MNERKWITGDNCISCGHGRVFFYEERTEDGPDGRKHFGDLICGACGASQQQQCFDYQIPDQVQGDEKDNGLDLGPLFGGAR